MVDTIIKKIKTAFTAVGKDIKDIKKTQEVLDQEINLLKKSTSQKNIEILEKIENKLKTSQVNNEKEITQNHLKTNKKIEDLKKTIDDYKYKILEEIEASKKIHQSFESDLNTLDINIKKVADKYSCIKSNEDRINNKYNKITYEFKNINKHISEVKSLGDYFKKNKHVSEDNSVKIDKLENQLKKNDAELISLKEKIKILQEKLDELVKKANSSESETSNKIVDVEEKLNDLIKKTDNNSEKLQQISKIKVKKKSEKKPKKEPSQKKLDKVKNFLFNIFFEEVDEKESSSKK